MKQTQEFEGKNTDQAIENACAALNVTKRHLVYDVISSGSSGIFGIVGVKKARIRVTLPKTDSAHSGKYKKNMGSGDSNGVMSIVDEAFGKNKEGVPVPAEDIVKPVQKNKKPESRPAAKSAPKTKTNRPLHADDKSARKAATEKPGKKVKKAGKPIKPAKQEKPLQKKNKPDMKAEIKDHDSAEKTDVEVETAGVLENDTPSPTDKTDKKNNTWNEGFPPRYKDEIAVDVSEDSIATGKEALQKMVDLITTDASITAETDQDKLLLKIEGGNSGVLIGRRGQTLEAMQFLCDKIINRKSEFRVRLKLDIEGYMETRKANLEALAYKMANKAKKTGRPSTINQMTAQDRRIVHLALKDDSKVRTQSMGEGYYRRLVIFPKRAPYKKNNPVKKKQNNQPQDD